MCMYVCLYACTDVPLLKLFQLNKPLNEQNTICIPLSWLLLHKRNSNRSKPPTLRQIFQPDFFLVGNDGR